MIEELPSDLKQALRAEAYRLPVRLSSAELHARRGRLDADRPWSTLAVLGWTAAIMLIVASISFLPGTPPGNPSATAGPSSGVGCNQSEATRHGSWWWEMGGPHAFFNIEPGTRRSVGDGVWLLFVRFDPDPGERYVELRARELETGERVVGRLNSLLSPDSIMHFDEPAPALPGAWYLFELPIEPAGCWQLAAVVDREEVSSVTVDVTPGRPASTVDPSVRTPSADVGAALNLMGTASGCSSVGGCGYFIEIEGPSGRFESELRLELRSDGSGLGLGRTYDLELGADIPRHYPPGSYTVTVSSFAFSDVVVNGQPESRSLLARCTTGFVADGQPGGVVIDVSFAERSCTASIRWVGF